MKTKIYYVVLVVSVVLSGREFSVNVSVCGTVTVPVLVLVVIVTVIPVVVRSNADA